jgi:hypothetical protein
MYSAEIVVSSGNVDMDVNCFEHVAETSTESYTAGEVWKVCLKEASPSSHGRSTVVEAVAVRVAEARHTKDFHRVLQTSNTSSNITIYVDEPLDSFADASACESLAAAAGCNLRSAIHLCAQYLNNVDSNCTVILPAFSTIVLDASLGELSAIDQAGTLCIEGEGSAISTNDTPGSDGNIRFMNVSVRSASVSTSSSDSTTSSQFVFHLANLTLDGFGGPSLKGGSIYLENLAGGSLHDVTCRNGRGSYGGAVFLDTSEHFLISRSRFVRNIATGVYN